MDKLRYLLGSLEGKTIGILGLSFKPGSDDMREARSLVVIELLSKHGCQIKAYDPIAMDEAARLMHEVARVLKPGGIAYFDTANALCPFPTEVKYIPFFDNIPAKIRRWITGIIVARFPSLVDYSLTPAQYWFTPTGLRKAVAREGFKKSWDLFDIVTRDEIPHKYRFANLCPPLLKKTPHLYFRGIVHFPLLAIRLFYQKG